MYSSGTLRPFIYFAHVLRFLHAHFSSLFPSFSTHHQHQHFLSLLRLSPHSFLTLGLSAPPLPPPVLIPSTSRTFNSYHHSIQLLYKLNYYEIILALYEFLWYFYLKMYFWYSSCFAILQLSFYEYSSFPVSNTDISFDFSLY